MQVELGIDVERFTTRESKLRQLLKEFRTIDKRIEFVERQARGDDLPFEPSITVQPQARDMMPALRCTEHGRLSVGEQEIASAVERHITVEGYASQYRVARKLQSTYSDDQEEDTRLQLAYNLLVKDSEDRVELTETERLVIQREPYIARARQELPVLIYKRDAVRYALDVLQTYYPDQYILIWHRDVLRWPVIEVMHTAGLNYTTEQETYKKRIRRAREECARWIPIDLMT